jgi:tyrosyl-tRNA synthetase
MSRRDGNPNDFPPVDEQLEVLTRGCEHIYTLDELRARLVESREAGRPLRVKLGMDPTAPDIHLGHSVVLGKMRHFQDMGHRAVLIIGDYTARIGDPSGRSKTRPMLSPEQVDANAATYLQQAGKILDTSPDKLEVRKNSEWLAELDMADVLKLTGKMTVARMLERDTFAKRYKAGTEIYIHEFLYPLMQGQDSVAIRSDVELGGTDQTFNNLVGRDLQRDDGQAPQIVVIMPILVGTDGTEKMSKSLGNAIGVDDPAADMYGKLMSIPDELMGNYYELLTRRPESEIRDLLDASKTHPRDAKVTLAKDIVAQYWGGPAADAAQAEFDRIHGAGAAGLPDEIPEVRVPGELVGENGTGLVGLIVHCGFGKSNGDARRLIAEGGVRLNGQTIRDVHATVAVKTGDVLQRGKRKFVRLVLP